MPGPETWNCLEVVEMIKLEIIQRSVTRLFAGHCVKWAKWQNTYLANLETEPKSLPTPVPGN